MSKLINDIPGFLGDKLSEASSPVDASLWQNIADKLPTQAPVPGAESVVSSSAPGMSVAAKIAIWSGAAVLTGAAGYGVFTLLTEEDSTAMPLVEAPESVVEPEADVNYEDVVVNGPEHPAVTAEDTPKIASEQKEPKRNTLDAETPAPETPDQLENQPSPPATTPAATPAPIAQQPAAQHAPPSPASPASPAAPETALDPEATADFSVAFDAIDELQASFSAEWQEGEHYRWDFGDGSTSEDVNPHHRFDDEGAYTVQLQVTDQFGNEVEMSASVEVRRTPVLVLPNIFTPNNDGLNDVLNISDDSKHVTVLRLIVFDQRGKVVYEQFGPGPGWDGVLIDGSLAPETTYRMVVTAEGSDGKQYNESSFVRLQR